MTTLMTQIYKNTPHRRNGKRLICRDDFSRLFYPALTALYRDAAWLGNVLPALTNRLPSGCPVDSAPMHGMPFPVKALCPLTGKGDDEKATRLTGSINRLYPMQNRRYLQCSLGFALAPAQVYRRDIADHQFVAASHPA